MALPAAAEELGDSFVVPLSSPSEDGLLAVHLNSGSMRVMGEARNDVAVSVKISSNAEAETEAPPGMRAVATFPADLEVTEQGNVVTLRSHSGRQLDVEIAVPSGFSLELAVYDESAAGIEARGVSGSITARATEGPVVLEGTQGAVLAHSDDGEVRVRVARLAGDQPLSVTSGQGDVHLTLPASARATASIHSDDGNVFSDIELTPLRVYPKPEKAPAGQSFHLRIEGLLKYQINGGGVAIVLKSLDGDIYLERAREP
jgi:hypothetical protein